MRCIAALVLLALPPQVSKIDDAIRAETRAGVPTRLGILGLAAKHLPCKQPRMIALRENGSIEGAHRVRARVCGAKGFYFVHGTGGMTITEAGPFAVPKPGAPRGRPVPFGVARVVAPAAPAKGFQVNVRSPDGRFAGGGRHDSTYFVWGRKVILEDRGGFGVRATAFAPRSNAFALSRSGGAIRVWLVPNGKKIAELAGPAEGASALAFEAELKRLAAVTARPDGSAVDVVVWDLRTRRKIVSFSFAGAAPRNVAWSPDGRRLAVCDYSGTVRSWVAATGKLEFHARAGARPSHVVYSPDSKRLAATVEDGDTVRIYDAKSGELAREARTGVAMLRATVGVPSAAFSSDGKQLAWIRRDGLLFLTGAGAKPRVSLGAVRHSAIRFAKDDATLVTTRNDGACYVWDTSTLR